MGAGDGGDRRDERAAELPEALRDELRSAWQRYVDLTAPLRPALHGYCRRLTGNLWDAEDLVQDTLLRAFGKLGNLGQEVRSPRAYLLKIATNLWIDTLRRRGSESAALAAEQHDLGARVAAGGHAGDVLDAAESVRDAGARLLQRLAPQEQAAVVLKDAFDLSLEETADVLETTVGAVKAALHRGRGRLREPEGGPASRRPVPSTSLVDRFVAAYSAGDLPGLTKLVLDSASVEQLGSGYQFGRETLVKKGGFLYHAVNGHPEWPEAFQYESPRLERALVEGEPVALGFCTRRGREALEQVMRFEEVDGRVARIRAYAFCPETMRAIGALLQLPVRTGLYRFPTPAPGKHFSDPH